MTFQTSDVEITSGYVRKVALAHCFAAFIFDIGVMLSRSTSLEAPPNLVAAPQERV